ncbi:conserved hypothetical protein [Beutenbergia cavernae DSM 12333]|uniref:Small multidrug efflux protein n=1 Tax=Beutenbergia cavernae (strain ATCC BAA-8 / DSM 12333 / CCUG 43141 / JCM 11478 / NBRC 16432 / NCIMB 13614 / HKI 0122) TaxID=471853 RepID=C5BX77_BEUC1|nr:hypothetical protein [Beutenbergia cavernae]ACQ78752.1 conserved hypothetical protein [Beutenbergia cavernae DSM 12333]
MSDLIVNLQDFTESLPPLLRWVGVMLAGLIPYVEAEGAALIGTVAGIHPAVAIPAAVLGNAIALAVVVGITSAVRTGVTRNRTSDANPKRERMRRVFDRWGVPGVSLLGPVLLPSHVTAAAMVGFGAPRGKVLAWGVVAVAAWAVVIGLVAYLGIRATLG